MVWERMKEKIIHFMIIKKNTTSKQCTLRFSFDLSEKKALELFFHTYVIAREERNHSYTPGNLGRS